MSNVPLIKTNKIKVPIGAFKTFCYKKCKALSKKEKAITFITLLKIHQGSLIDV
tara:strand:- start:211 stop:372 length:162 start_codon:yes stop_codon:yes gene_type:complete